MNHRPYDGRYAPPVRVRGRQRRRGRGFLLLVLVLAVAALLLKSRVFVLKTVNVQGSQRLSVAKVMEMAGLSYGESIFSVSQRRVEERLSGEISVEFLGFEKTMPDTVSLTIRERQALACVHCGGEYLLIDETGYIMSRQESYPDGAVLLVSGMDAYVDRQGKHIESSLSGRRAVMNQVIEALRQKEMLDLVSELNVANLDEVYLVSVSGVQVVLGEAQDLPEKLEWMRAVLAELTRQGVMRGVLDVSTGKNAVYADR